MGDMDETLRHGGDAAVLARLAKAVKLQPEEETNVVQLPVRDAERPYAKSFAGFPDKGKGGIILNTMANARHAVKLMGVDCSYDVFHDKLLVGGHAIGEYTGELSDHVCLILRRMIEEEYAFEPGREKMFDACVQLCLEGRFDPVLDYLDGLVWDGTPRVNTWLTTYMGAEDTKLNRAIGKIALVAMVGRARQPGVKFDQIITLESKEGYQKSTALAVLAGAPENFSDQTILGRSDKEQQELLRGVWLYEISDLSNMGRAEVEHIKAFASRTHDRARPAYGRARIDMPRRGIIFATTNSDRYLKSQTGNRRFWPFKVGVINVDALKRDRDQLLAEAVAADKAGASLVLPRTLWDDAGEQQEQRREVDPWEDVLQGLSAANMITVVGNEQRVFTSDILGEYLAIPKERQSNFHLKRVADCMRQLDWFGPKVMKDGSTSKRGFWRPVLRVGVRNPESTQSTWTENISTLPVTPVTLLILLGYFGYTPVTRTRNHP